MGMIRISWGSAEKVPVFEEIRTTIPRMEKLGLAMALSRSVPLASAVLWRNSNPTVMENPQSIARGPRRWDPFCLFMNLGFFGIASVATVFASDLPGQNAGFSSKTPGGEAAHVSKRPASPVRNADGNVMGKPYEDQLASLQQEIKAALPTIGDAQRSALEKAREMTRAAEVEAKRTQEALGKLQSAKALVDHAKGKWIGGAEKGIAQAQAALEKARTDPEREAAKKNLAKWQADKEAGLKALKERQEALEMAKIEEPNARKANEQAQEAWTKARTQELAIAKALLAKLEPCLAGDKLDAKLTRCAALASATPRGLAAFAQQGAEHQSLVNQLFTNEDLLKQMLEAGGAKFGQYGQAMKIYTSIRKASPKAAEGIFQRLALATSLEHAKPIPQSNPADQPDAPATVDPVKRYQHYEKAFLDGELDPVFKDLSTWELRMVVGCDAPDAILAWGREMLRNYRPDHIHHPDYGWRYSSTVRTEVPYGSQNVKNDLPSLQKYQNIILNGGVCGRRAFFGRYILQCFGIPTWGVTQKAHAALSHWTPKGWVINFGAGYERSWWDKDESPRSGVDFLLETQARAHGEEYLKVLRARWISLALGEQAYNDRKGVAGGFWSNIAHYQSAAIAATAVRLGPLGHELAEANESKSKPMAKGEKLTDEDRRIMIGGDGSLTIPAVAHHRPTGPSIAMKGIPGGMQLHCTGGYKSEYEIEVPESGRYAFSASLATVQMGQKLMVAANEPTNPIEVEVPYTIGKWEQTRPVEIVLVKGKNIIFVALTEGSRGVSVRKLALTPVK